MPATFEDLKILKTAEDLADSVWRRVLEWREFPKDVVGKQLARAADSIGANIAESFGRYHFGEKLQFLYYARGSLFETKYWINRARARDLLNAAEARGYIDDLTALARQLNAFAGGLKNVRAEESQKPRTIREPAPEYRVELPADGSEVIFNEVALDFLQT